MAPRYFILALLTVLFGATGCIEFDRQTVLYRYQADQDQLRLVLIYEGIHGEDELDLTDKEVGELTKALSERRAFFFSNWLFSYSDAQIASNLTELEKSLQAAAAPALSPEAKAHKTRMAALVKAFGQSIKVVNGEFFLNGRGELCGYQIVTISGAKAWLATVNEMLSLTLSDLNAEQLAQHFDEQSRPRVIAAGKPGYEFFKFDGNRLVGSFPLSWNDFLKYRQQVAGGLRAALAPGADKEKERLRLLRQMADMLAADMQLWHADGQALLHLGQPGQRFGELTMHLNEAYNTSALPLVKQQYGINSQIELGDVRGLILADH